MGFFSKLTCDTNESVASIHSGHPHSLKPVYMLQPNGQPPIKQDIYEGYGVVGMNWFIWLSTINHGVENIELGVFLDCGTYLIDENGVVYACAMEINENTLRIALGSDKKIVFFDDYGSPIKVLNEMDMNTAIKKGLVKECRPDVQYPVKLSYNALAKYDDFPASLDCPQQGFFYDDA